MRTILYTGKGGVGKTSVAAATALLSAQHGYRTVVMSTDPAHSLADSLDTPLGAEPAQIAPSLWAQEVDVLKEMDRHWRTVRDWLSALMQWQGAQEVLAEELAVLPGMEELAALLYLVNYRRQGCYDVVIVDCAPTGETLRLLSFPDMARWYMHRLFPLERKVAAAVGPLARGIFRLPVPGAEVFNSIQRLYNQLEEMREILQDASSSSVRLVVNPEKMVIKEAQRTYTYLNLYGYQTDLIVCNRVLPRALADGFFSEWKKAQEKHLETIHETFAPLPIFNVPLMPREVVGLEMLREMGRHIFGDRDPSQVFYQGQAHEIAKEGDQYVLTLLLPLVSKEEVLVLEAGDELVVQVGWFRRNILLPRVLLGRRVAEARLEGSLLRVWFTPREDLVNTPVAKEG